MHTFPNSAKIIVHEFFIFLCQPVISKSELTLSQGPKIQSCHHLAPHMKLRSPNLKYEALEISEVSGPFEGKVLRHYRHFGPL